MPKVELFGGENGDQYNALMQALSDCADDEKKDIYCYLEKTPKTSLVVELVDKLIKNGFLIIRK